MMDIFESVIATFRRTPTMKHPRMIDWRMIFALLASLLALRTITIAHAQSGQPSIRTYKTVGSTELKAHIFLPVDPAKGKPHAAIILLHGGGWNAGSPEWVYGDANRYSGLGMVAIAGEYRLSDQKNNTPLEAMSDVRDLIRWVRQNASDLGIDPHRIAVYGISAGAHLAAAAAVFPHNEESNVSALPDALLLLSPPASILNDRWPQMLLGTRAEAKDISPAENVKIKLPPMIIVEGAADTETPLIGAQRFCDRAKELGGTCELNVYPGLGHLLSRNLDPHAQEEGPFDPDPASIMDAHAKEDAFLTRIGYTK
jgi:acetyl esterase